MLFNPQEVNLLKAETSEDIRGRSISFEGGMGDKEEETCSAYVSRREDAGFLILLSH